MNLRYFALALVAIFAAVLPADAQIQAGKAVQIFIGSVPADEKAKVDGIYPVSEGGTVNMPLIGQVRAAGLRSDQLAQAIQNRYTEAGIYTRPTVQVIFSDEQKINQDMVHIGGQVRRNGPVPHIRGLTIYQAIQAGGGATEFGDMKRVKLFRGVSQKQYDLTQAQFMRIPLEPNDTVEVPQKRLRLFGN